MSQGTSIALMGMGMSGEQAGLIGADPSKCVGIGTSQTGAAVILTDNCELSVSSGQTAVILPSSVTNDAVVLNDYWITNQSGTATNALVFVPSGHKLNGTSNASLTLGQFKSCIMWQYKYQNWTYVLTA
jgi:hypothetical protein